MTIQYTVFGPSFPWSPQPPIQRIPAPRGRMCVVCRADIQFADRGFVVLDRAFDGEIRNTPTWHADCLAGHLFGGIYQVLPAHMDAAYLRGKGGSNTI